MKQPNFVFRGSVNGKDLLLFNKNYGNSIGGVFQVQILNTDDISLCNETFDALKDLARQLGYVNVFAYEVNVNMTVEHREYSTFDKIGRLKTINSPGLKAIKLLNENKKGKDLTEDYISEISVERIANLPNKSAV